MRQRNTERIFYNLCESSKIRCLKNNFNFSKVVTFYVMQLLDTVLKEIVNTFNFEHYRENIRINGINADTSEFCGKSTKKTRSSWPPWTTR